MSESQDLFTRRDSKASELAQELLREEKFDELRQGLEKDRIPDVVIITGMSGSGRTQALHVFEDMGYYCIDNLPPRLILDLANLIGINESIGRHLAVTCDLRSQGLFEEIQDSIQALGDHELSVKVLFLDASDEVLIRRYDETRRKHPIAFEGETLTHAIGRERIQLQEVKNMADMVLDTTNMRVQELKNRIRRSFSELEDKQLLEVRVFSFGFKHGMPDEADLMIDVRFLPNPFYDKVMRTLTGNDELVSHFVLDNEVTQRFLKAWASLLDTVMPGYVQEGKSQLSIAIGCTGGQHRSVAIANATADYLVAAGYKVSLSHRDIEKSTRRAKERA